MGRKGSTTVTMNVDVEIETEDFIDNAGVGELVEACVEHGRDTAYAAINIDDFNEWARASGYAPSIDAKMLIDDRESPISALVEVANEALKQRGIGFVEDFIDDSRLDDGIRDELKIQLWPTLDEIAANHDDQWQHYLARIVSEFIHLYGSESVLKALREQNALQAHFRVSMEGTTQEARIELNTARLAAATVKPEPCDCGDVSCGVPLKPMGYSHLAEAIDAMHDDADKLYGKGHFVATLLCAGDGRVNHIRAEIVEALTPEIERKVKKGLIRKLLTFVFGEDKEAL